MSFNQRQLREVKKLCSEVSELITIVQDQIEAEYKQWNLTTARASKQTGELRRRSLDLTRALADLRRS